MNRNSLALAVLVLAFIGLADAAYLAETALTGGTLSCSVQALDGCNIVAQSPYARLFGIPLGVYGAVFYGAVFALSAGLLVLPHRRIFVALFAAGALGAIASIIFLFIQFMVIKAVCVYCITSAIISFIICFAAWDLWKRHAPPLLVKVG